MADLVSENRCSALTVPASLHHQGLSKVHLSWVGDEYVASGFRSYVKYNEARGLVASGAGTVHTANILEIYECESMSLHLKHQTDNSSCWCMVWLPEDRYATGSNDSMIRIWADGELLHT